MRIANSRMIHAATTVATIGLLFAVFVAGISIVVCGCTGRGITNATEIEAYEMRVDEEKAAFFYVPLADTSIVKKRFDLWVRCYSDDTVAWSDRWGAATYSQEYYISFGFYGARKDSVAVLIVESGPADKEDKVWTDGVLALYIRYGVPPPISHPYYRECVL